jgi:hypothetical protein
VIWQPVPNRRTICSNNGPGTGSRNLHANRHIWAPASSSHLMERDFTQMFPRALVVRLSYRHGFPFTTSVLLAAVTAAWPRVLETRFHEGTSIWTVAILVAIATVFALLCGGRFRTFFIASAVTPPFLLVLPLWLESAMRHPEFPIRGFVEYFFYFVAAPVVLVRITAKLLDRKEQRALTK